MFQSIEIGCTSLDYVRFKDTDRLAITIYYGTGFSIGNMVKSEIEKLLKSQMTIYWLN